MDRDRGEGLTVGSSPEKTGTAALTSGFRWRGVYGAPPDARCAATDAARRGEANGGRGGLRRGAKWRRQGAAARRSSKTRRQRGAGWLG